MENLVYVIIPLILSGLGFLVYKHPPVARQILKPLQYFVLGIFVLLMFYNMTQSSAYYKSLDAARINITLPTSSELDIDSLLKVVKDQDSLDLLIQDYRSKREKINDIEKYQFALKDSIQRNIHILINNNRQAYDTYSLYCFVSFLLIIVFVILSFLFDNIHNKEKVKNKDTPKETPD